jgi:hypothetical protein
MAGLVPAIDVLDTVIPREGGGCSTLRLPGKSTGVSGILDHPLSRAMTVEHAAVASRFQNA